MEIAGLGLQLAVRSVEGQVMPGARHVSSLISLPGEFKKDFSRFSGFQRHLLKSLQLAHRPYPAGHNVMHVQLNHFFAFPVT